ncbi:hypothetical protein ACFT7S_34905 [Streptomyces sp. NPDC057136]|uniref:hypothetical protein n=1 Tax=Streptomyces sp. NPDC057136 TaxID=3346029 RepID=UPI0036319328
MPGGYQPPDEAASPARLELSSWTMPMVGHDMCRSSAVLVVERLTTGVAAPAHPHATGHFIKALPVIEPFIN